MISPEAGILSAMVGNLNDGNRLGRIFLFQKCHRYLAFLCTRGHEALSREQA